MHRNEIKKRDENEVRAVSSRLLWIANHSRQLPNQGNESSKQPGKKQNKATQDIQKE